MIAVGNEFTIAYLSTPQCEEFMIEPEVDPADFEPEFPQFEIQLEAMTELLEEAA